MSTCENEIDGKTVTVEIFQGCNGNVRPTSNWLRLGSRQGLTFNTEQASTDVTGDDSGDWTKLIANFKTATVDIGGVYRKDDAANVSDTHDWFVTNSDSESGHCWVRLTMPSKKSGFNTKIWYVRALMQNFNLDSAHDAAGTYSSTVQSTGLDDGGAAVQVEYVNV